MNIIPNFSKTIPLIKSNGFINFLKNDAFMCLIEKTRVTYWNVLRTLSKKEYKTVNVLGHNMQLSFNDLGISQALMLDKIREVKATNYIQTFLDKGDIVLDIGANIGYYVLLEARVIKNTGHIYAIEPIPSNIKMLKRNIELNNYQNVDIYTGAMGEKVGIKNLHLSVASNQASFQGNIDYKERKRGDISVNINTVDNFLKDKECPTFIRMDVEGYECKIFQGAKETLKNNNLSKIFIELHSTMMGEKDTTLLFRILQNNNFEIDMMTKYYGTSWVIKERLLNKLNKKYDIYSTYTINDVLNDKNILSGKVDSFHIFFKRRK